MVERNETNFQAPKSRDRFPTNMSSGDYQSVRAEIKAWERAFKERNGNPPNVEDIKQNPAIGASSSQTLVPNLRLDATLSGQVQAL